VRERGGGGGKQQHKHKRRGKNLFLERFVPHDNIKFLLYDKVERTVLSLSIKDADNLMQTVDVLSVALEGPRSLRVSTIEQLRSLKGVAFCW
jgi:hypothetical protein